MSWPIRFLKVAEYALRREDLRQRFIHANADDLPKAPGIIRAYEHTVVLAIFEAASAIYSDAADSMRHEMAYPGATGRNPKRADLAFKEAGRGKNWAYIETKYYGTQGIRSDIDKLRSIRGAQRWMFVYFVRDTGRRTKPLRTLLDRTFVNDLEVMGDRHFPSFVGQGIKGRCEMVLARVK